MSEIELESIKTQIINSLKPAKKKAKDLLSYPESLKLGKAIISYLERNLPNLKLNKPLPSFIAYKTEIESDLPHDIKHTEFLDLLTKEIKKIKVTDTQIVENEMSWEDALQQEISVIMQKEPNLNVKIISPIKMEELIEFKTNILKAIDLIKASPISKLYKAVAGDIYIGTEQEVKKQLNIKKKDDTTIAEYHSTHGYIVYYLKSNMQYIYATMIHEISHKFHHKFMKAGFDSTAVKMLYAEAMKSTAQCYLDHLPKIGDSLSNLRDDWWTVRKSSEDFILSEIQKGILDTKYIYMNSEGQKIEIEKKDILKRITCPSKYGASDALEFFAEMCVLITLGLVKPNQQVIANKFMEIITAYSK